ncbi:unnamed protein product [Oppiella nova]|uniref:Uncharacterized protein n=1 Tax=Oppiella nova TaxID=334625 RepID=A0A7R9LE91_9ACAR|nr:unnamed protein product [Oppiella nova]CAG2161953.1 unnamed protein product [Oppiella nova]
MFSAFNAYTGRHRDDALCVTLLTTSASDFVSCVSGCERGVCGDDREVAWRLWIGLVLMLSECMTSGTAFRHSIASIQHILLYYSLHTTGESLDTQPIIWSPLVLTPLQPTVITGEWCVCAVDAFVVMSKRVECRIQSSQSRFETTVEIVLICVHLIHR